MGIEISCFSFHDVVKQIDWHYQQGEDHDGDDSAGAEVDAFASEIYHSALVVFVVRLGVFEARFLFELVSTTGLHPICQ